MLLATNNRYAALVPRMLMVMLTGTINLEIGQF